MSEDSEISAVPVEEPSPEVLAAQLEKAAGDWDTKAEAETQAADGHLAKEMLYRATADAMRHALHAIQEKQTSDEGSTPAPAASS